MNKEEKVYTLKLTGSEAIMVCWGLQTLSKFSDVMAKALDTDEDVSCIKANVDRAYKKAESLISTIQENMEDEE